MFPSGFLVALIDLDEGIRLLSNLCDVALEDVRSGLPVEVFFERVGDDFAVPQFRPRREGAGG